MQPQPTLWHRLELLNCAGICCLVPNLFFQASVPLDEAASMKRASGIVFLILLTSCAALAADKAQLAIDRNAETVKDVAEFVLMLDGYSVGTQGPDGILFVKDMPEKTSGAFLACGNIPSRLYLTLSLSKVEHGTVATVSAVVEHAALVGHREPWMSAVRQATYTCETVRENPIHAEKMLTDLLEDIASRTTILPRESVTITVSPTH
jgi:hypothetical protein